MDELDESEYGSGSGNGVNRKKWSKPQYSFNIPDIRDERKQVTATSGTLNYIAQLEAKNREKKRLQEEMMDPKEREMKKREKAFRLNWSGANKGAKKNTSSNNREKDRKSTESKSEESLEQEQINDAPIPRGKWNKNDPIVIKGSLNDNSRPKDDCHLVQIKGHKKFNFGVRRASMNPKMFADEESEDDSFDSTDKFFQSDGRMSVTLTRNEIALLRQSLMSSSEMEEVTAPEEMPSQNQDPIAFNTVEVLIDKMKQLNDEKQQFLLKFLEKLEKAENPELDLSVFDDAPNLVLEKQHNNDNIQYCFRVHSTWGHDHTVGLTEIELLDQNGQHIDIPEEKVQVKGGLGGNSNVMRLFNGNTKTTTETHMWQTTLPTLNYLEILVEVPCSKPVSQIRIWNFNKNANESVKGVKMMEILKDCETIWKGTIQRGCGNNVFDYSTLIDLEHSQKELTNDQKTQESEKLHGQPSSPNSSKLFEPVTEVSSNGNNLSSHPVSTHIPLDLIAINDAEQAMSNLSFS